MPDTAAANIHVDEHARAMADYISRGEAAALALGNRGPIRLDDGGNQIRPFSTPGTAPASMCLKV